MEVEQLGSDMMVYLRVVIIQLVSVLSHCEQVQCCKCDGEAIHFGRCPIQDALYIVTHHELDLTILRVVDSHSEIVMNFAMVNNKWHNLPKL